MPKVKNLNGTQDREPKGATTWLSYWEKQKGSHPSVCAVCGSPLRLCGAHVKKCSPSTDRAWYIAPLCPACNQRTDAFVVSADQLVPVRPKTK